MSAKRAARAARGTLEGAGLVIPSLHPQPLPISLIAPAPCTQACPAGVQVKAYVSLIAERRFSEALEVVRRRCPLPGVCGRVCHHPCEAACRRGGYDEPVAIRSLKRFVADLETSLPVPVIAPDADRPQRVAIIGSGPAGLTAAIDLRRVGFPVTIYEADDEPGGMLRYGITAYRLPREVLEFEILALLHAGVKFRCGTKVGRDIEVDQLLGSGYGAVLLAVGAQNGRRLDLAAGNGAGVPGVEDALAFLRRVNAGERQHPGDHVLVIGGGSTAIEAARSAIRLGAQSVEVLYRRFREELLAARDEIEAAEAEGVRFRFLVAPVDAELDSGRLAALRCVEVGLREPDASGRRRPIRIPGSEFTLQADRVLAAVGQEADLEFLPASWKERIAESGLAAVDHATAMTSLAGVFAAGDVVSGPSTVIEAIAAGHSAAESIRHYLEEGRPGIREQRPEPRAAPEYGLPDPPPLHAMRVHQRHARRRARHEFEEVEQPLAADDAVAEARRCLRCGPCGECSACAPSCSRRHIVIRPGADPGTGRAALLRTPASLALGLPIDVMTPAWVVPDPRRVTVAEFDPSAATGVNLRPVRCHVQDDRCRGCGRCVTACAFGAASLQSHGGRTVARIEPALCRGCNLCTGVCPTGAAVATALSPEWWGTRIEDVFEAARRATPDTAPHVVLACQRRAGSLEAAFEEDGVHVEVIRFRCVGQIEAGMLTELCRQGARGVLVAGCTTGRCRFGAGASLAAEQVGRAQSFLRLSGGEEGRVRTDWSGGRAEDPLDPAIRRLLRADGVRRRARREA